MSQAMYSGHSHRHHTELCLPFQGLCIGLQSRRSSVAPLPASQLPPLAMQRTHQTQVMQDDTAFVLCMAVVIWLQCSSGHLLISSSASDCRRLRSSSFGCRPSTQPGCCGAASGDQACGDAGLLGHSRSPFSELLSIRQQVLCTLAPPGQSSGAQGTA